MTGMSRQTGGTLDVDAHLAQSVGDILTTARGTRVMRRDYGSDLPRLIDAPLNGETLIDIYAAAAEALARWEPRLRLIRVSVDDASAGALTITLLAETVAGETTISTDVARVS